MIKVILLLGLVAAACAGVIPYPYGWPYNYAGYYGYPYHYFPVAGYDYAVPKPAPVPGAQLVYYGQFEGTCENSPDGLYYVDDTNFAYCTNGNKYIQPCAEGSANPPLGHFIRGNKYLSSEFCAVNLVAHGYRPIPVAYPTHFRKNVKSEQPKKSY